MANLRVLCRRFIAIYYILLRLKNNRRRQLESNDSFCANNARFDLFYAYCQLSKAPIGQKRLIRESLFNYCRICQHIDDCCRRIRSRAQSNLVDGSFNAGLLDSNRCHIFNRGSYSGTYKVLVFKSETDINEFVNKKTCYKKIRCSIYGADHLPNEINYLIPT